MEAVTPHFFLSPPLPTTPPYSLGIQRGIKNSFEGIPLVVQWLRLCTFTAEAPGLIPSQETKIPQAE